MEIVCVHRDGDRFGALSIDDGRHVARLSDTTRLIRTGAPTRLGAQTDFGHRKTPWRDARWLPIMVRSRLFCQTRPLRSRRRTSRTDAGAWPPRTNLLR